MQPDDYFAAVEKRFEKPSPYRKEAPVNPKHQCDQCDRSFATAQGLAVHIGRSHSKMERKPKADHPWRAPAVMPSTAPEPRTDEDAELVNSVPLPESPTCEICDAPATAADPENGVYLCEECAAEDHVTLRDLVRDGITLRLTPNYRMELIETLADLADRELYIAEHIDPEDRDFSLVYDALTRIKAVARDV